MLITIVIPTSIVMYCITDIVASDGVLDIVAIVALITCTRNQNDTLEAILTNLIDNGLEEIVQCTL